MGLLSERTVSILTPAYNHAAFVEQSLRSAWAQTHANVEHVIVDDHSTDETPNIIQRLLPVAPIPTKYIRNDQNLGPGRTVNRAFAESSGDWVCFLASDDAYAPWKIEHLLAFADSAGPEVGVVHADCWAMSDLGAIGERLYGRSVIRPADGDVLIDYALGRVGVNGLGALIRRDVFAAIGGNDPALLAEDFDFYLRLARVTRFAYLDEGVAYVRFLSTSLGRSPSRYMDSVFHALEKQREALGPHYARAVHAMHLRAFDAFVRHGPREKALHHARLAVETGTGAREALDALGHLALSGGREAVARTVAPHLPAGVQSGLRALNRFLMRRSYGVGD